MLDMSVENPWVVVFHEYAHQLMNGNLQEEFAPWFEEGFAVYFQSIEVDSKEARVGKIPNDDYAILHQTGMMKIADLFRVRQNSQTYNESGDHRTTFYAESGMLVHYIYDNQLLPKVAAYFDLVENKHMPVEDAIQQAFGMSTALFDKALRNYVNSGHYKYYPIPTPASISEKNYTAAPLSARSRQCCAGGHPSAFARLPGASPERVAGHSEVRSQERSGLPRARIRPLAEAGFHPGGGIL